MFKMSLKGFQIKRKNVSENTVKLKFKENIKSLLYNRLVYIRVIIKSVWHMVTLIRIR